MRVGVSSPPLPLQRTPFCSKTPPPPRPFQGLLPVGFARARQGVIRPSMFSPRGDGKGDGQRPGGCKPAAQRLHTPPEDADALVSPPPGVRDPDPSS